MKLKKYKFFRMILTTSLIGILLFTMSGCGSKNIADPDKTMDAFYQMIARRNVSGLTALGINKEEADTTLKTYRSSMISTLKKSFSSAGVPISTTQAEDITDAVYDKLGTLDYEISIKKENEDEASVKVSSCYIDYLKIFKDAKTLTINNLKPQHIETLKDAKKELIRNIIKGFETAEVSDNMHSKTFQLKKQKVKSGDDTITLFFPEDPQRIGSDLVKLITNQ